MNDVEQDLVSKKGYWVTYHPPFVCFFQGWAVFCSHVQPRGSRQHLWLPVERSAEMVTVSSAKKLFLESSCALFIDPGVQESDA